MNIPYGDTFRQKLDIYGTNLKPDCPLFVYVHGGYWQMMDKWNSAYCVAPLVKQGIRVIVVDYDLCPQVTLEQLVAQVHKAFKWISNYVRENAIKNLSIAGHSAGAHLLAMALTKSFMNTISTDVKFFAYLVSGVYDLTELRFLKAANENGILSLNDENVRRLSPQFNDFSHLKGRNIRFFVFAGACESEKFQQQTKDFAEIPLKDLDSVDLKIFAGLDHFDIVEKLSEEDFVITQLIASNSSTI